MEIIDLDERTCKVARRWSDKVMSRLPARPNYTSIHIHDRFYKGYLGELGLFKLFMNTNKSVKYFVKLEGKSDDEDFILHTRFKDFTADIKTTGSAHITNFLLNKRQYMLHPYDVYIGARVVVSRVIIMGYCRINDLSFKDDGFTNERQPTYFMPLKSMFDIRYLLDKLRDGKPEMYINGKKAI